MLIYRRTSILESSAQTLVNTVNCVGVMGKGLAEAFKERDPSMFASYKRICDQKLLAPGKLWLWRGTGSWVLNFPTKMHWRNPSKIDWIEAGLQKFVSAYEAQGITEISFPLLGCGNGGLLWDEVKPVMESYLSKLPIPVFIHDYKKEIGLPEHMEPIALALRAEPRMDTSFDSFVTTLRRAITLAGAGTFTDLESEKPFSARMTDEELLIDSGTASWSFEEDDLRGVWLNLQRGLVTKKEAGWSVPEGSGSMLSLLSVLPDVRPIEIQRSNGTLPEIAIEPSLAYRNIVAAQQTRKQHELAWG